MGSIRCKALKAKSSKLAQRQQSSYQKQTKNTTTLVCSLVGSFVVYLVVSFVGVLCVVLFICYCLSLFVSFFVSAVGSSCVFAFV
jgi:hypothetical protein